MMVSHGGLTAGCFEDVLSLEGGVLQRDLGISSVRVKCGVQIAEFSLQGRLSLSDTPCTVVFLDPASLRRGLDKEVTFHYIDFAWERGALYLVMRKDSAMIPIADKASCNLLQAVETCAGIGALGIGLVAAFFEIATLNDIQETTVHVAGEAVSAPGIVGDVADLKVVSAIHGAAPQAGTLAAGVSCQPYSRLGDSKGPLDSRSASLPAMLRAAFLSGKKLIIIECVTQAQHHEWVQAVLNTFCAQTNFVQAHC